MTEPFKQCSCGACYTAEQYFALSSPGPLDDGVELLDLRQCSCESTMAVVIACRVSQYARDVLLAEAQRNAA
jgi:hypothetical protein